MDGFLSTPSLKPLAQSLCLGFDDLPVQLRTCLLYCTMYPYGYEKIERDRLVRKWIAEGLVLQEEVARAYFDKLVYRRLLQPVEWNDTYSVNPMMLPFLVCKAKEENFVAFGWQYNGKQMIRRLSLIGTDRYHPDLDVSSTHSLTTFGDLDLDGVSFSKFKNLRVLDIDSCKGLEKGHLVDICGFIWLRYLRLNDCRGITELPREIGRLQNLETLDVSRLCISKLPEEIEKLQRLVALNVGGTDMTELPKEIGKLVHLQYLKTLGISNTKVTQLPREIGKLHSLRTLDLSDTDVTEVPAEIMKLHNLRNLDITGTKVRELLCYSSEVPNSFIAVDFDPSKKMKSPLRVLRSSVHEDPVVSSCEAKYMQDLSILMLFNHFRSRCEILQVRMLRVAGRHMKVPGWVRQDLSNVSSLDIRLCKLEEDDLEFLKRMPNLQALILRLEVLPREPIAITGGGFSKLETFYVDCRMPGVITFKNKAMPKLKHLEFKFYTGRARQSYSSVGITQLPCLETLVFRCSRYYTSESPGISETIDVVRKEAAEHPNEITLWVNDKGPEVFWSLAEKAIREERYQRFWAGEMQAFKKRSEQLYRVAETRVLRERRRGMRS